MKRQSWSLGLALSGITILFAAFFHRFDNGLAIPALVLVIAACLVPIVGGAGVARVVTKARTLGGITLAAALGTFCNVLLLGAWTQAVSLGIAALAAAVVAATSLRRLHVAGPLVGAHVVILTLTTGAALVLWRTVPHIDVWTVLTEGCQALLRGENPYGITYSNTYSPAETLAYLGPDFVVGGRVPFGFPYPPISLLLALPAYLLGDVRLTGVVLLTIASLCLVGDGREVGRRRLGLLLVTGPGVLLVLQNCWTESSIVAILAGVVLAVRRERLIVASLLLAALIVSKQYFVVALPCLWLLRGYATRARVSAFLAGALVLMLPWFLLDPRAFVHSVIGYQIGPPLRPDSLSVVAAWAHLTGTGDQALYRVLPLAAGIVVAAVFAVRRAPGLTSFVVGVALALATTVLLSKQAFFNYYFLVGSLFLVAAWTTTFPATSRARPVIVAGPRIAPEDVVTTPTPRVGVMGSAGPAH